MISCGYSCIHVINVNVIVAALPCTVCTLPVIVWQIGGKLRKLCTHNSSEPPQNGQISMFLNIIWRASSMFVFQIKEPDINGCILDSISPNEFIGTKHSDKRSSVQNAQSVCSIPSIHNQRKFLIKILFLVSCFVASLVGRCFNINSKEINNGQQRKSPKPQTNHNTENYLRDTIKNL